MDKNIVKLFDVLVGGKLFLVVNDDVSKKWYHKYFEGAQTLYSLVEKEIRGREEEFPRVVEFMNELHGKAETFISEASNKAVGFNFTLKR